jgi:hypothetical protein
MKTVQKGMVVLASLAGLLTPTLSPAYPLDLDALKAEVSWHEFEFGPAHEAQLGRSLPVHFSIALPDAPGLALFGYHFSDPNSVAHFVWVTPEEVIIESVEIFAVRRSDLPLAMAEGQATALQATAFVISQALPDIVGPPVTPLGNRVGSVNGMEALEWVGTQDLPDGGLATVRIICLPSPSGTAVLCFVGQSDDAYLPPGGDYLGFTVTVAYTLLFLAEPDDAGVMQPIPR